MDSEPSDTHDHPEQRGFAPQSKDYMAEKLRGAAVMFAEGPRGRAWSGILA